MQCLKVSPTANNNEEFLCKPVEIGNYRYVTSCIQDYTLLYVTLVSQSCFVFMHGSNDHIPNGADSRMYLSY